MKKEINIIIIAALLLLAVVVLYKSSNRMINPKQNNQAKDSVSPGFQVNNNTFQEIPLVISSPKDGQVINQSSVTVRGTTVPDADIAVNEFDSKADSEGNFSVSISLEEGDNAINILVNDNQGKVNEKEITVTYDSGQYE